MHCCEPYAIIAIFDEMQCTVSSEHCCNVFQFLKHLGHVGTAAAAAAAPTAALPQFISRCITLIWYFCLQLCSRSARPDDKTPPIDLHPPFQWPTYVAIFKVLSSNNIIPPVKGLINDIDKVYHTLSHSTRAIYHVYVHIVRFCLVDERRSTAMY